MDSTTAKSSVLIFILGISSICGCKHQKAVPATTAKVSNNDPLDVPTSGITPKPGKSTNTSVQPRPLPTHDQTARAKIWLDTIAARNRRIIYAKGYRIQAYLGPDRIIAMKTKETLYRHFDGQNVYMTYAAPNFKVQLGDFLSRLDAQLYQRQVAKYYSMPLIIDEEINLR